MSFKVRVKAIALLSFFALALIAGSTLALSAGHIDKKKLLSNEKLLEQKILSITDYAEKINLSAFAPFEWDTLYAFQPYTSKEYIYETVGYKWDTISETVSEDQSQIVFLNEKKVVCYVFNPKKYDIMLEKLFEPGSSHIEIRFDSHLNLSAVKYSDKTVLNYNGRIMTIDDVTVIAGKGDDITTQDFNAFDGQDVGAGFYILLFDIEGGYKLLVHSGSPDEKPLYVRLAKPGDDVYDENKTIDIRYDSLEKFLKPEVKPLQISDITKIEINYNYFNFFEDGYKPYSTEDKEFLNMLTSMMNSATIATAEEFEKIDRANNSHAAITLYKGKNQLEISYIIDDLYSTSTFDFAGIHYSPTYDMARLVQSLEEFRPKSGEIEKSSQDLLKNYGWDTAFYISASQIKLPGNLLQKSGEFPTKLYWSHNLELSKDIGLDFSTYLGQTVTAELYRLVSSLPAEFYPQQHANAVILKQNSEIIGAYITAGKAGFGCSLAGKSFQTIMGHTFESWFAINGYDMQDFANMQNAKLTPEEVVEKYIEAINAGDNTKTQYMSVGMLKSSLFSNTDNHELYLSDWADDNVESIRLLKIEQSNEPLPENRICFKIEADLKVKQVMTIDSGIYPFIVTLEKESLSGWKILEMGF